MKKLLFLSAIVIGFSSSHAGGSLGQLMSLAKKYDTSRIRNDNCLYESLLNEIKSRVSSERKKYDDAQENRLQEKEQYSLIVSQNYTDKELRVIDEKFKRLEAAMRAYSKAEDFIGRCSPNDVRELCNQEALIGYFSFSQLYVNNDFVRCFVVLSRINFPDQFKIFNENCVREKKQKSFFESTCEEVFVDGMNPFIE